MRVTSILFAGVFALVASAQTTVNSTPTIDPATAAQASNQAESLRCIQACKAGDVDCTSKCIAVPNPNEEQVNETNNCVTACPLGKGSEADNAAYEKCVSGCINSHYFTASAGTPQSTGGSSSGNGNGNSNGNSGGSNNSNGENAGASGTNGNEASGTASGAAATSSTGAAHMNHVSGAAAGLVGFMAAVLAL
ncbi:hypothetical protein BT67DRAFT_439365 [Trichocladium antarcticum]|uniref:Uncharacterized protein n=1 Tax=Trichocladium antarcticum TaxID=1450529 RepID=A0AAN6UNM4_9PEZI|nr:hypothetical protein BT67DRAFT_439365 [Trichocladium antarcticum]